MKKILWLPALLLLGCIDEVQLPVRNEQPRLVVEGQITNEPVPYSVRLSFTGTFTSSARYLSAQQAVNGARVVISSNAGDSIQLTQQYFLQPGLYQTTDPAFIGRVGRSYTLSITLPDGRVFTTKPEKMVAVPPIDQLTYTVVETDRDTRPDGYQISVDTQDPPGVQNYYLWRAYGFSGRQCGLNPTTWVYFDDKATNILSDQLIDGNPIRQRPVLFSPIWSRVQQFLEVAQYSLSRSAFQYYRLYREQQERTGTIFDPLPAPIEGNVRNRADTTDRGLGYFVVSAVSRKKLLITPDVDKYTQAYVQQQVSYVNPIYRQNLCTGGTDVKPTGW